MVEKKEAAAKPTTKKATTKKVATKKEAATVYLSAENAGFRAGDVYNALAAAEKALSVAEIAKAAKISVEDSYLGIGWLFKEGKVKEGNDNKVELA